MFTKDQLLNGIKRSKAQQLKAFDKLQEINIKLRFCRSVAEMNRLMKLEDKWRNERSKAMDSVDRLTRLMIENGFTMTRDEFDQVRNDKNFKMTGDVMFQQFGGTKNRKMFFQGSKLIGIFIF